MANIKDGNGGSDYLSIHSTAKAARVILYDSTGNIISLPSASDGSTSVSLTGLNQTTSNLAMANYTGCGVVITSMGNAANVITIQFSVDGCTTWVNAYVVDAATGNTTTTITSASTYSIRLVSGVTHVRAKMTSYTSGTATGQISATVNNANNVIVRGFTNVLSSANSTLTNLNSSATFTGTFEADLVWVSAAMSVFADQNLTIVFEQSIDGTNVSTSDTFYYRASTKNWTMNVQLMANYHRIKITNTGGSATTTLTFQSYNCPNNQAYPRYLGSGGRTQLSEVPEKATYRSAASAFTNVAGANLTIKGSATKTIRVTRIGFSATAGTGGVADLKVDKLSNLTSGTPASITPVPLDSSSSAATATVQSWGGGAPTITSIGVIANKRYETVTAAVSVIPEYVIFDFGNNLNGSSPVVLRGTSEWVSLSISAIGTTPVADMWIEHTEEDFI